jgi:hypothetical protein
MVRQPGRGRGQSFGGSLPTFLHETGVSQCVAAMALCAVAVMVSNVVSCVVGDRSERPDQEQEAHLCRLVRGGRTIRSGTRGSHSTEPRGTSSLAGAPPASAAADADSVQPHSTKCAIAASADTLSRFTRTYLSACH